MTAPHRRQKFQAGLGSFVTPLRVARVVYLVPVRRTLRVGWISDLSGGLVSTTLPLAASRKRTAVFSSPIRLSITVSCDTTSTCGLIFSPFPPAGPGPLLVARK